MNIIFDGNFLCWKGASIWSQYHAGKDIAEVLRDKDNQQQLLRKFVIDMCGTISQRFPVVTRVVVVFDSVRSWRYNFHDDYKYALTRVANPWKDEFVRTMNEFEELLAKKGIITSRIDGAEGDDLMYFWSLYFDQVLNEPCICITADSDMRQIITPNVSLFNNNSKNLKCYTHADNERFWRDHFDIDVEVKTVVPFETVLAKAIMGDSNDNIPKLKTGFGEKAFERFLQTGVEPPAEHETAFDFAYRIAQQFGAFTNTDFEQWVDPILVNLRLTWLCLPAYVEAGLQPMAESILEDIGNKRDFYSYELPYSLENIYGMLIK